MLRSLTTLNLSNRLRNSDIPVWLYRLIAFIAIGGKLIFASFQRIYLALPAPIDDGLMYEAAVALTEGRWLGEYNHLTLSKHMGFAFWEAFAHLLGVPILVANQFFIAAVCLLTVAAFSPIIQKRWQRLLFFLVLFFSPTTIAEFTLRPYRDSIFPFICLAAFACFIAVALREEQPVKKSLPYLIIGGFALGFAFLTREDGYWILPFTVVAGILTVVYLVIRKKATIAKVLSGFIPYAIMTVLIVAYCTMNYVTYGRFIVSDFSSGEFSAVIGAMTRVEPTEEPTFWSDEKISIPYSVRRQLYDNVQHLAPLEELLEGEDFFNRYGYVQTDPSTEEQYIDYSSGGFYWALRHAAAELGVYDDAISAQQFWQNVADEINYLCDEGTLPSRFGERNSTMPPIRSDYVLPVIGEAFYGFWYALSFQDTSCYMAEHRSFGGPEDIVAMEEFLHSGANTAAMEGTALPYYHPIWLLAYKIMNFIRLFYMILTPIAFAVAVAIEVKKGIVILRAKNGFDEELLLWLISAGIILMAVFRSFIIAFVQVASFTIDTYVMYLATLHPLILVYIMLAFLKGRGKAN